MSLFKNIISTGANSQGARAGAVAVFAVAVVIVVALSGAGPLTQVEATLPPPASPTKHDHQKKQVPVASNVGGVSEDSIAAHKPPVAAEPEAPNAGDDQECPAELPVDAANASAHLPPPKHDAGLPPSPHGVHQAGGKPHSPKQNSDAKHQAPPAA